MALARGLILQPGDVTAASKLCKSLTVLTITETFIKKNRAPINCV